MAFIPNPENKPMVGHDNDVKLDNSVSNLYWTDAKENNCHNGKYEAFKKIRKEKMDVIVEKLSKPVKGINTKSNEVIYFKSTQDASRHGFDNGKISMCCRRKRNTHKGYKWEYIDEEE